MITSLQTLAAGLDMDAVTYQATGMIVVFTCLSFLSLILTVSGSVAVRLESARKAKEDAAKAALASQAPAPVAVATPVAPEPTPAEVAALAAGIYDAAASSITPQVVAAIAAAVKVTVGNEARILDIKPIDGSYGQNGRISIMNSHFPTRR
ncbi:MAG: OadG family protein [Akkermansia sp.]|nr:OadG family protein [Akkermansia sp.]